MCVLDLSVKWPILEISICNFQGFQGLSSVKSYFISRLTFAENFIATDPVVTKISWGWIDLPDVIKLSKIGDAIKPLKPFVGH